MTETPRFDKNFMMMTAGVPLSRTDNAASTAASPEAVAVDALTGMVGQTPQQQTPHRVNMTYPALPSVTPGGVMGAHSQPAFGDLAAAYRAATFCPPFATAARPQMVPTGYQERIYSRHVQGSILPPPPPPPPPPLMHNFMTTESMVNTPPLGHPIPRPLRPQTETVSEIDAETTVEGCTMRMGSNPKNPPDHRAEGPTQTRMTWQTTDVQKPTVPAEKVPSETVHNTDYAPMKTITGPEDSDIRATESAAAVKHVDSSKAEEITAPAKPQKTVYRTQVLPARERQLPKRLSRKERRRLLTASLPRPCLAHTPTLRELRSITFSDYVKKIVIGSAVPYEEETDEDADVESDSEDEEQWKTEPMPLAEGIAKVTLPVGFWPTEQESWTRGDRTGRGEAWQPGTPLGDYRIESPIEQHVRGLAGVYEYSFVDKGPLTLGEFRDKADAYRTEVVGCPYDVFEETKKAKEDAQFKKEIDRQNDASVKESESHKQMEAPKLKNLFTSEKERLDYLERYFWKRLGPTMPPALYGADHEGTLFSEDDDATGWSIGQLDSCLHVLPHVPGVTSPYLYAGMWGSVFCAHTEDMNLLSINYLHAGAPKIWYAIAPGPDAQRFESLCASSFVGTPSTNGCKEFLRHKRSLLSPKVLLKAGIKFTTAIQRPGDAIITFPAGYHFGFNSGFNLAEATNFAVPEWIPFGLRARVCLCRPDSVRIDMNRLTGLLEEFNEDQRRWRRKRLSWKEWSAQKHQKRQSQQQQPKLERRRPPSNNKSKRKVPLSEQQRKREFWIEVVRPLTRRSSKLAAARAHRPKKEQQPESEEAGRGKRKRKLTAKAAKWEREQHQKKAAEVAPEIPSVVVEEIWHLAKPLSRKSIAVGLRVLCLLPGTTMGFAPKNSWKAGTVDEPGKHPVLENDGEMEDDQSRSRQRKSVTDDEGGEDEQCFTGQIVEMADEYARIHIDGLPRSEDVWMDLNNNKVYLDGGHWDDEEDVQEDGRSLPQLHYWEEMDSKRRCV